MTTTVLTPATPRPTPTATVEHAPRPLVGWAARDALTTAWRTLLGAVRTPQILLFALVQPVMFVLLFRYVFGGAIDVPGGSYVDYLMPGIFVQTAVFSGVATGVGLAEDLGRGVVDRFRSLPMAASAVLSGRALADAARTVVTLVVMLGVGLAVGYGRRARWAWSAGWPSCWRCRSPSPGSTSSSPSPCAARRPRSRRASCSPSR